MRFHLKRFANLDAIVTYIRERGSFEGAERWFDGIVGAIRSLAEMPDRCPLADESVELATEVRLLLHGKRHRRYKIYFAILRKSGTVRVFHVRPWAMKPAGGEELEDLMDGTTEGGQ